MVVGHVQTEGRDRDLPLGNRLEITTRILLPGDDLLADPVVSLPAGIHPFLDPDIGHFDALVGEACALDLADGDVDVENRPGREPLTKDLFGEAGGKAGGGPEIALARGQTDGDAGQAEDGGFEGSRDGAGVSDIVAEIGPVIDARDDDVGPFREDLGEGQRDTVGRGPIDRVAPIVELPNPQRPRQGEAVRRRALLRSRGDDDDLDRKSVV